VEMASPLEDYLAELCDLSKPLVNSKLSNLSDLSPDEVVVFRREWPVIDAERRQQIVARLVELSEDNLELDFDDVFRSCLTDDDSEVRAKAIEGLWECEELSLVDALFGLLLGDAEHSVREAAATALGKFALLAELGKLPESYAHKVEDTLTSTFTNEKEILDVRCKALEAIGFLSKAYVEGLIRLGYQSESLELRASALYAMGRNCNSEWLPILLKELDSPYPRLRFEALRSYAELEAEEAVLPLVKRIDDSDALVRVAAIQALGQIGGSEAKEALEMCLESEEEFIRETAEEALQEIGFWQDPLSL
jgi:HEAT repeat protein